MRLSRCQWIVGVASLALLCDSAAAEDVAVNRADMTPLFDGDCVEDEWQSATRIALPSEVSVFLMHDDDYVFVCAQGKPDDFTVVDLYIRNTGSGELHNLHASAQLGERILTAEEWGETDHWNLDGWGGFWVPYAGEIETEAGSRTRFLRGTDREIQVGRGKFPGTAWTMMISVSAVNHDGGFDAELSFPEGGVNTDASTWRQFSFTDIEDADEGR